MTETLDFSGGLTLQEGEELGFLGIHDNGEAHLDYYGEYTFTLPVEYTDLIQRANDIASGKAKSDGYKGRLIEQLEGQVYVKDGGNLRTATQGEIAGADLYLFYHSSKSCRWSGRFTPDLVKTVDRLRARYPGKIRVIYVSSDRNMNELQDHYKTVGASAVMPPRPDWYIDTFSQLHPTVRQINQPSFMLMNANGRLIDSGMRQESDYASMFSGLEALPAIAENDTAYVPAWTRVSTSAAPSASVGSSPPVATPSALSFVPDEIIQNTDASLVGPIPYTTTLRDGTEVPGLVIHDTRVSGSRIPALTLQAFPPLEGEPGYYSLSFRQVLGKTYGSKPLLAGWITSVTSRGENANAELMELVSHYKAVHAKFSEWRQTAVNNGVSNFEKQMYVVPMSHFDTRVVLRDERDNDLELFFKVFDDPRKATFKGDRWSLTYDELDAFERLIPQIDALVSQLPGEIVRTAQAREQRERDAKSTDALFE
ncbi:MAG: thioredoxin-like domain-containing protein [Pseudomonadota bacterium]